MLGVVIVAVTARHRASEAEMRWWQAWQEARARRRVEAERRLRQSIQAGAVLADARAAADRGREQGDRARRLREVNHFSESVAALYAARRGEL